jgi:ferredoxin, 2Fe-2S
MGATAPANAVGRPPTRVRVLPHPELCPDGAEFDARTGRKLIDELLANGVEIEHACEKVCACATCHIHLRAGGESVTAADDEEEDQIDDAWGVDPDSRLACCVKVRGPLMVVELPRFSRNHARER